MTGKLLAFAFGVSAVTLLPVSSPGLAVALLLPAALYPWRWRRPVLFLLLGLAWAWWRMEQVLGHELPRALEGRTIAVEGRVASLPERSGQRLRFVFEPINPVGGFAGRMLLSWYSEQAPSLAPGERWRLYVRLKRPHGMANPGGFDYEAWLLQRRIRATGYVRARPGNIRLARAQGYDPDRLRQAILEQLQPALEGRGRASLVYALGLGARARISPGEWQMLRHTGTTHLLAISGLHIGMIALLVAGLARLLWRAWPRPRPAAPRFALYAAMPPACLYALLAGFTLPTQRALVMLLVVYATSLAGRRTPASTTLALALAAVLALDPLAPLAAGFWFSFGTVAMLVFGLAGRPLRQAAGGAWWQWGRAQYLASLILLPLAAAWFRQYPLLSLPCNLLAVPWVGFCSLPLTFCGLLLLMAWPAGGATLLAGAAYSLELLCGILEFAAQWHGLLLELPQPSLAALLIGAGCVLLLALPRGAVPRLPLLAGLLPLLAPAVERPAFGDLHLALLDVGQGLSVVARTHSHVLVYDTGARLSERLTAAEAALLPYLGALGIRRIDRLIVSHADDDHAGGLAALGARYPGLHPWSGEAHKLHGGRPCRTGQSWTWDGVRFEFLHPGRVTTRGATANDRSCVLRIAAHGRAVLLTGDIERAAELQLLRRHGRRLGAAVMQVPHHGSRTSSTPAFVHAAGPDLALVSAGYQNRFGFPKTDIIGRYTHIGSRVVSTVDAGMIEVRLRRSGVHVAQHRQRGKWWQARLGKH